MLPIFTSAQLLPGDGLQLLCTGFCLGGRGSTPAPSAPGQKGCTLCLQVYTGHRGRQTGCWMRGRRERGRSCTETAEAHRKAGPMLPGPPAGPLKPQAEAPVSSEGPESGHTAALRLPPTRGQAPRSDLLSSVQFSHSVMSKSLQFHGLQHARLPCPSPTPRACSNSCPLSR